MNLIKKPTDRKLKPDRLS